MYSWKGHGMATGDGLLRATLAPLAVVAVGVLGVGIAYILDLTSSREWALTIGAPAFLVVAGGLIWLLVALIWFFVVGRNRPRSEGS